MWRIISASRPGTSHARDGAPCQDAHGHRIAGGHVIAAVGDGLGSATKSDEGAKLAVNSALDMLGAWLSCIQPSDQESWMQAMRDVFARTRQNLERLAKTRDLPLREYGTTLIVVVITRDWLALGHLGDGAVVVLTDEGAMETVSAPQCCEYANEVIPLTSPEAMSLVHLYARKVSVKAAALLTDGLQNLSINTTTRVPYAPFFDPFFSAVRQEVDAEEASIQLAEFLGSERVCTKTDDDKTLVIIGKAGDGHLIAE